MLEDTGFQRLFSSQLFDPQPFGSKPSGSQLFGSQPFAAAQLFSAAQPRASQFPSAQLPETQQPVVQQAVIQRSANQRATNQPTEYIGRFAPSPSGDLHFGSLIAALGSYLQARAQGGKWLVRIEDIDPPREVPGAASRILAALEHYGLHWDGPVIYQSQRHEAYRATLNWLEQQGLSYYCTCTRSRIHQLGGFYDGYCRDRHLPASGAAIRLRQTQPVYAFYDKLLGELHAHPALAQEDFIIRRRDGLFAYNLAVVVDDAFQGVTEIVRGADLIEPTVRQIALYQQLQHPVPGYIHLPLALNNQGNKLSKQNHAPPLPNGDPRPILIDALKFLRQPLPEYWQDLDLYLLLRYAVEHWTLVSIPLQGAITPQKTQRHSQSKYGEL
ncbi:glutamyl-queuosine tRNA(Asp) synthetase [Yersinia pestis 1522]|nr:tRNA glutamyl-Q(34) synthetase GluQRS [Yersinia pestis]AAS60562.1 putative glutamyl-tRNA synthetase [Yersinia pestis biovar Microtus str. 91001]ABP41320.1 glutamyl-tRNA synthetase [Yersinia pestis Pestoides F]ABX86736.1 glutamyl-Q tRNA(Asp) synthetase [Yersinia pestis Angola]AJK13698.1 glutamyl-queuosine tRNA(Asp) synthetase [Yersinia pestis str. Pestoides B]AJK26116.1 glutamyl-queuosine tRNA(Asp) synthetase [Yersinia pestis Pestoides G]AKS58137.1 glutamyl-queuosine tRNA(Asp) synthetase [Y